MTRLFILLAILFVFQSHRLYSAPGKYPELNTITPWYNSPLDSVISSYTGKVNADSIEYFMQQLENFGTRFCLAENRREVAIFIRDRLTGMGYADTRLDSFLLEFTFMNEQYISWQYNVISTYAGYGSSDSVFILGAHYDSIIYPFESTVFTDAPGADDNASGVAAALEVARIMKAFDYLPKYTLKFVAFGAEELGLHGSWHYANKASQRQENIIAMVNNDMISHATKAPEEWTMQIQYYNNSQWLTELTRQIASNYTSLNIIDTQRYIASSDSWPFYSKGYQTVFLHEDQTTPHYHTINDKVSGINPQYAAEMVKVSMGLLVYLNGLGKPRAVSSAEPDKKDLMRAYSGNGTIQMFFGREMPGRQALLFDLAGRLATDPIPASNPYISTPLNVAAGLYILKITGPGIHESHKLFISR